MKFVILAAFVVGLALAVEQDMPIKNPDLEKKSEVMQLLEKDLTACENDEQCKNIPEFKECSKLMKFCKPKGAPEFELEYGSCQADRECRPKYHCKASKCHFGGPKPCQDKSQCLQGIQGVEFECKENAKSAPGKRCWMKCSNDRDCFECEGDKCRIMGEARAKIGCCQGTCQKKAACM